MSGGEKCSRKVGAAVLKWFGERTGRTESYKKLFEMALVGVASSLYISRMQMNRPSAQTQGERIMHYLLPSEDIRPISQLGGHTAKFLKDVQRTRRPIFLTNKGKAAGVLIDIAEYEYLLERIAFHETILASEAEADRGEVISHEQFERESKGWTKVAQRPKNTRSNGPKRRNGR